MRIAIVHTRLLFKGGLETRLWSYMRHLQGLGHEVNLIVFQIGEGISAPPGVRIFKVNISWVPKPLRAWVFDRHVGRIVKVENFDFVLSLGRNSHQDALLLPGNHLGYLKAMGKRWKGLSDRLQIKMDAKGYASDCTILACSEMMKEEVVEFYGVSASKIKVLFPPSDPDRFHFGHKARQLELKAMFGMDPAKQSFVFVSASHGRKGLPLLLEVFTVLQQSGFELFVAGDAALPASAPPNVKSLGFVRETELLYAAAEGMVLPARYEPYGQVVSESLMCGTPVIISSFVGARSVVGQQEGIVLDDLHAEAWVAALRQFVHTEFSISEDFATQNGLSLDQHMQTILACPRTSRK